MLQAQLTSLKEATKNDRYQIVLGLSGGIDSSYLALRAHEWDLRVLAVHVDAGWDTPEALANINLVIESCGFDYQVVTPNWETIRQLQLASFRSGLRNQDIPQDHAFFSGLYGIAHDNHVRNVLSGWNVATESIISKAWGEPAMDSWLVRDLARRHKIQLRDNYPLVGAYEYFVQNPYVRRMKVLTPLNLMPYSTLMALRYLSDEIGFTDYGSKHSESYLTRYIQSYYMPKRLGIDKRQAHLSSRVLSGEITRTEAIEALSLPPYDPQLFESDKAIIAERLEISLDELESFSSMGPNPTESIFTQAPLRRIIKSLQTKMEAVSGRRIGTYS